MNNIRLPFQIESFGIRGRLVRLGTVLDEIVGTHGYPDAVGAMLGEAVVLAVLLAGALKYDGVFTLQTKGDGPISLMVADVTSAGAVRAYAQYDAEALARENPISAPVPRLLGVGYLAFTVDQGSNTERYQGIVELEGATLADCVHHYFRQSEQIETGLIVSAGRVGASEGHGGARWGAGGIMIQRLPPGSTRADIDEPGFGFGHELATEAEDEGWRSAMALMGTVSARELTEAALPPQDLLFRLFHEEGVRIWPSIVLDAKCRCSKERIAYVLSTFPRSELAELEEDGEVAITCEFCGRHYTLDSDDLDTLDALSAGSPGPEVALIDEG